MNYATIAKITKEQQSQLIAQLCESISAHEAEILGLTSILDGVNVRVDHIETQVSMISDCRMNIICLLQAEIVESEEVVFEDY